MSTAVLLAKPTERERLNSKLVKVTVPKEKTVVVSREAVRAD